MKSGPAAGRKRGPSARNDAAGASDDQAAAPVVADKAKGPAIRSGFSTSAMLGVGTICYPVVASTGLASLLTSRIAGGLDREQYSSLLGRLEPSTLAFQFRDGEIRYLDKSAVETILGVVSGDKPVQVTTKRSRSSRVSLIEDVQGLLGMPLDSSSGIGIDDLKKVLLICDPAGMSSEEVAAARVAFTLLACSTFLSLKQCGQNINLPDEVLCCVLNPGEIGQYNWAGYILDQHRVAAAKYQEDFKNIAKTFTLGGCNLVLQVSMERGAVLGAFF
jgi:hypothetical protein